MSSTIDQQFVEYIVKTIVSNPDAVEVKRTIDEKGVLLELTVDQEDLGRVIGKRGIGAQSLRTLLRALGTKNDARYNLKIVDVGEGERPRKEMQEEPREPDESNESSESADSEQPEEPAQTEEENVDEPEEAEEDNNDEDDEESRASRTRKELEDLDDLDI